MTWAMVALYCTYSKQKESRVTPILALGQFGAAQTQQAQDDVPFPPGLAERGNLVTTRSTGQHSGDGGTRGTAPAQRIKSSRPHEARIDGPRSAFKHQGRQIRHNRGAKDDKEDENVNGLIEASSPPPPLECRFVFRGQRGQVAMARRDGTERNIPPHCGEKKLQSPAQSLLYLAVQGQKAQHG